MSAPGDEVAPVAGSVGVRVHMASLKVEDVLWIGGRSLLGAFVHVYNGAAGLGGAGLGAVVREQTQPRTLVLKVAIAQQVPQLIAVRTRVPARLIVGTACPQLDLGLFRGTDVLDTLAIAAWRVRAVLAHGLDVDAELRVLGRIAPGGLVLDATADDLEDLVILVVAVPQLQARAPLHVLGVLPIAVRPVAAGGRVVERHRLVAL